MSNTPKDIDTELAAVWHAIYKVERSIEMNNTSILHAANAKFYYRGRQRVTDMKLDEALVIVNDALAAADAWKATHSTVEGREWGEYVSVDWVGFKSALAPHEIEQTRKRIAQRDELNNELNDLLDKGAELESHYTGWSRFFLVTSSPGHVHSSMHCSTCRVTTKFGWLPELSGKDEATAVRELGPTLCSVCFPSAPVEWTAGKKITAAKAAKMVA